VAGFAPTGFVRAAPDAGIGTAAPISVVIPTCRRPDLLARALASVRAQSLAPAEIVVVDDGGDAAARPACGAAGARLVANTHARGPSGARNCGAALARGIWLAFLDDDDEWLPPYLATALAHLAAEGLDVLCADLLYHYEDGTEQPGKSAPAALAAADFLIRNPGLIGSNLVIRRATFAALGGFDESLLAAEDMDLGIRLSLQPGVRYAPLRERLVRHHHHAGPRLCTPHGDAMRAGIRRFFALHGPRMDATQRAQFHRQVRTLWGFDELGRDREPLP
jgi:glycosyltransferase involved in cell wall biosynthesis